MTDPTKSYVDPVLGLIVGYSSAEEFYAACEARNIADGLTADGFPINPED